MDIVTSRRQKGRSHGERVTSAPINKRSGISARGNYVQSPFCLALLVSHLPSAFATVNSSQGSRKVA